jgi:AMMECR1 domain-containing protein
MKAVEKWTSNPEICRYARSCMREIWYKRQEHKKLRTSVYKNKEPVFVKIKAQCFYRYGTKDKSEEREGEKILIKQ